MEKYNKFVEAFVAGEAEYDRVSEEAIKVAKEKSHKAFESFVGGWKARLLIGQERIWASSSSSQRKMTELMAKVLLLLLRCITRRTEVRKTTFLLEVSFLHWH